jgi:GT2 family glycosyltransferase/glycosyltransferase involved in cell wall biosynthesis
VPFTRDGLWTEPTTADLTQYQKELLSHQQEPIPVTEDILRAIEQSAPKLRRGNDALFKAVSRIEGGVDIVMPVYGGLHVLKPCLDSIQERTNWDHELYLVDDCSPDPAVGEYLRSLPWPYHIARNSNNRGFAATVNHGAALGKNPYICVMNTDVVVTEGWLTKMLVALESDERNIIVNPATNNTAMINVDMYPGTSYRDMARALDCGAELKYQEIMPTGFCMLFRRTLWEDMGPFDEAFGSYGEESDFWFRSIRREDAKGNLTRERAVIADNAYVFHERGTSFSQLGEEAHTKQRQSGSSRFHRLHPEFGEWSKGFKADHAIGHLRGGLPKDAFPIDHKANIAWVVKSSGNCGGMAYIADIVNELIERGYNAKVCVVPDDPDPTKILPIISTLRTRPIRFSSQEEFVSTFAERVFSKGVVFAAVTELSPCVWKLDQQNKGIIAKNHVQSWDVGLCELIGKENMIPQVEESYKRLPNVVSSNWVAKEIKKLGGKVEAVTSPGVDPYLFHPRNREAGDDRFTVAVLLADPFQYKGGEWGRELLQALRREGKSYLDLRLIAIGPTAVDVPGVTCMGSLSQSCMAEFLGTEVDVFVDPSQLHSYGLPALEALCSGCKVFVRPNRGHAEYSKYWKARKGQLIVEDDAALAATQILTAERVSREIPTNIPTRQEGVRQFIDHVFPKPEKQFHSRIEVVTPHLRKHGGPTTNIALARALEELGHDVSMSTIYTDWNPEVLNYAEGIPVRTKWKRLPSDASAIFINSDNPFASKIMELNPGKKYIMYKLSHNERFKQTENDNLDLDWDRIVTSSEWLREACITPMEGWTHKAWDPKKVANVGWYHYGHPTFDMPPGNRTYGTAQSGFRVGTLIHGHPLKGTAEAIGAIDALKRKYEANFHAVGFGEQKAKLAWYMQYIRAASREDFAYAFKQLDIWLGASHTEGLGRLALEAMSAGVAVVTTDTGAEHLKDGENCLLYAPGDAATAAKLVDKLANDQELFSKLVINGYETASGAADPAKFKSRVNKVIKEVVRKKS